MISFSLPHPLPNLIEDDWFPRPQADKDAEELAELESNFRAQVYIASSCANDHTVHYL
jgi:hypothetical protein